MANGTGSIEDLMKKPDAAPIASGTKAPAKATKPSATLTVAEKFDEKMTGKVERLLHVKIDGLRNELGGQIESLALAMAKGFEKNEQDHRRMWQFMNDESRITRSEIHDIKMTLMPFSLMVADHEKRLNEAGI